ncbi:hypothetical protein AG1IA_06925 [Rhizoctonia solani AG-1 IA]|uniref:Uncharacterized protein n=1 Tax=Thanatephorus cucumeris (strain AG1-IA) TaxID=983506 RepID=L8WRN6_THACA|nr:hypothetical protein AG1IA_06925 [Rhizoctonia solani AG-1 IA]
MGWPCKELRECCFSPSYDCRIWAAKQFSHVTPNGGRYAVEARKLG